MLRVRERRWPVVCVLLSGIGVLGLLWFNLLYYPGIGLDGIGGDNSGAALTGAAKAFAESESLFFDRLLDSDQLTKPDGGIVAWSTVALRTRDGQELRAWVALQWTRTWGWNRYACHLLADPRDRILFSESQLGIGSMNKVRYVLRRLWAEELRRFREVHRVLL